jgi:hypothetical protein
MKLSMVIEITNPQSNGKLISMELKRQGNQVQMLDMRSDPDCLINRISEFSPEVVMGTHTHRVLSGETIKKIRQIPSKPLTVLWY